MAKKLPDHKQIHILLREIRCKAMSGGVEVNSLCHSRNADVVLEPMGNIGHIERHAVSSEHVVAVPLPGKCIQSVFIQRNHTIPSGLRKVYLTVHDADLPPRKIDILPS